MNKILCIDPGFTMGLAVFNDDSLCTEPIDFRVAHAYTGEWQEKTELIVRHLCITLTDHKPKKVFCEMPEFWKGSEIGAIAADKGYLTHLAYLVGSLAGTCWSRNVIFKAIEVKTWKGQMTKPACDKAIERRLGKTYPNHVADAVGIGLFVKGFWV